MGVAVPRYAVNPAFREPRKRVCTQAWVAMPRSVSWSVFFSGSSWGCRLGLECRTRQGTEEWATKSHNPARVLSCQGWRSK